MTVPHKDPMSQETTNTKLDAGYLLDQYGQAMAKVGQLEDRIRTLEQQANSHQAEKEPDSGLQKSLEEKDRAIDSLNAQITALTTQLNDVRTQPSLTRGGPLVKRRRRGYGSWWRFWRKHQSRN